MVESHSSNFRVIATNFLGVRIFRKFTVCPAKPIIAVMKTWQVECFPIFIENVIISIQNILVFEYIHEKNICICTLYS